ncbi:hypothetical protein PsYK624_154890 [Phanerochaete sordida]|uniref:Uncharacterized protein n=1 Tax=Phanerochaete sordida TaxID=48140 RepID=A0A9P3GRX1_9APHY|nr:hypothetical protein PsYK624_154890 [Phanerochaete sordida]
MRQLGVGSSISAVLLRNGTIYFIALLVINILQLVTYSATFSNISYVVSCVQFMPPLLVQRFMLNLRQHGSLSEEDDSEPRNGTCSGTLNFRSPTAQSDFLGNIGEPLVHGSEMRAEAEIWDEEERHGPPVEGSTEGTGTESTRWPGPAPLRDVLGSFDGLQGGSGGPELATCACEAACGALLCKRL